MALKERLLAEERIKASLEKTTLITRRLVEEVKDSFLDYAMSVITSRALPDIKDGLKPVHRRILYSAYLEGMFNNKRFKKSASLVGSVMGWFHPHGDSSIYGAMARMAQDFSLRYPLIEGQGNFGSIDGDSPAAMRYTEAKLSKLGEMFLDGIKEECVDFVPNYDGSKTEPIILPTAVPNILINGSSGIAVGMATNIPPHNLTEVCDALLMALEKGEVTVDELMEIIKGPDFPIGGQLYGQKGIRSYLETGKGSFRIRSKVEIVEGTNKNILIIKEIPYLVKKTKLIQQLVSLARPPKGKAVNEIIKGSVLNIKDESSSRSGIRLIIELSTDYDPQVVLNNFYKNSNLLQKPFACNLTVLDSSGKNSLGKPITISVPRLLRMFLDHQLIVLIKRTTFNLSKLNSHIHILEGRQKVVLNLAEVVKIISEGEEPESELKIKFDLSDIQLKDILGLPLRSLKKVEKTKLEEELKSCFTKREEYQKILASEDERKIRVKEKIIDVKERFGDARRTEIMTSGDGRIIEEDLIPNTSVVVSLSKKGYISQTSLENFKLSRRRSSGVEGLFVYKDDFQWKIKCCKLRDDVFLFTSLGRAYRMKSHQISMNLKKSERGKNVKTLLTGLKSDERVIKMVSITSEEYQQPLFFLFATKKGVVKKVSIDQFKRIRSDGKIACKFKTKFDTKGSDELVDVVKTDGKSDVFLASSDGRVVRFSSDFRELGRQASGRWGMAIGENQELISVSVSKDPANDCIISVGRHGVGKATIVGEIGENEKTTTEGGFNRVSMGRKMGVKVMQTGKKTGSLVVCRVTDMNDEFLFLTKSNKILRMKGSEIKIQGRVTQGTIITKDLSEKTDIVSFSVIEAEDSPEEAARKEELENLQNTKTELL